MALLSSSSEPSAARSDPSKSSSSSTSTSRRTLKPYVRKRIRIRPKSEARATKTASDATTVVPTKFRVDVGRADNDLPLQSSRTTRILFETIGPHVEPRTLRVLTGQLARAVAPRGGRGGRRSTTSGGAARGKDEKEAHLTRRLGAMFGTSGSGDGDAKGGSEPPEGSTPKHSWGVKAHPWMRPTLYDYFMGKLLDKPYKERGRDNLLAYRDDPTYPPNQIRLRRDEYLDTLVRAREASLRRPIFWTEASMREAGHSFRRPPDGKRANEKQRAHAEALRRRHAQKGEAQLRSEAEALFETLASRLPPRHFHKLLGTLEGFVGLDGAARESPGGRGRDNTDSWCIDDGGGGGGASSGPLPSLTGSRAAHADWKKHRIPILGKFLSDCSPSHSHLVALDLGRYFYSEPPAPGPPKEGGGGDVAGGERKAAAHAVRKQPELQSAEKRYKKVECDFVRKVMGLQHRFASVERAAAEEDRGECDDVGDASRSQDAGEEDAGDDDDVSSDLMVDELQKQPLKKEQVGELAETLVELRQMDSGSEEGKKKKRGRPRKDMHLHFTAIRMEEKDESISSDAEIPARNAELEQRLVFINNLPIDTTPDEIDQIYSRCGPLESIQLFNLRPDLDPGPQSKKQLQERRKKKLRNKNEYKPYKSDTGRPRTPVYGMLRFKTAEGYRVATSPELCIFGCVVRRHPVLSIKHQDVTTLYLEQLPHNLYSMDVEHKLAELFRAHNVHVMLDGMKGVGTNGSGTMVGVNDNYEERSKPLSCQVKFEDFHTASQAYQWMKEGEDGEKEGMGSSLSFMGNEECQLHWFKTPEDSMGYWTRELSF